MLAVAKREQAVAEPRQQEPQGEAQQQQRRPGSREHAFSKKAFPERTQPQALGARGGAAAGAAAPQWQQDAAGDLPRRRNLQQCTQKHTGLAGRGGSSSSSSARSRGAQSLTALTALGTVALYTSVRGGISVFHHLRRKYLRQLLFDLCAVMNELGLCYWLDFGSLLGIHRDGDLILHDNDIDLAVLDPDWPSLLAALQAALPQYSMRVVVPSDDPSTRFLRVYCPLGMADVFGATPAGKERLLVDCGHGSCTEISRASVLPTGLLTWRGAKISVPGDITAALEERYGADWRVPKYMDKGADVVEGQKLYARIFRALSSFGIRI